jgi:hypothetical protein
MGDSEFGDGRWEKTLNPPSFLGRNYGGQASNLELEDAFGEGAERDRRGACATREPGVLTFCVFCG